MKVLIKRLILEGIEDDYKQRLIKDNPYLGMQMVNHYVNEFKKIKNNLPPDKRDITKYGWEDLEQVVDSNQSIEKIEKSMIEVDNSDVLYNQNNLKILKANTKQSCIKYGTGYGFCISSRGAGNQYYNYRYGNYYDKRERSIYFVIDEDKTKDIRSTNPLRFKDPTHMLVIMVTKEMNHVELPSGKFRKEQGYTLNYQVTNANNDGDKNMTWDDIVKLQPKLNGLQKLFQPLKANPKEYTLHIAKQAFLDRMLEWRNENEEWLGRYNYDDLRLNFGDSSIEFFTNSVETLEFNYKLLNKIKELSINYELQVYEFNDTNNVNVLTFATPLFSDITDKYELKYKLLNYLANLNFKGEIEIENNNPIIKKDAIFVDGYVGDSNIFKLYLSQYGRFSSKFNISRVDSVNLDEDFDRYLDEINKLHREYINDITYTLANT